MAKVIKGAEISNVDIYLVDLSYSAESFELLDALLKSFGLNENNIRMYIDTLNDASEISDDDRNILLSDIKSCNNRPKVVMAVGGTALNVLCPDVKGGITKNRGLVYKMDDSTGVVPVYHPKFVMKENGTKRRLELKNDIKSIMDLVIRIQTEDIFNDAETFTTVETKIENMSTTIVCDTYDEFDEFCKKNIDNNEIIAYDIETNAKEVTSVEHKVVGFSLASSKELGCYVPMYTLESCMSVEDIKKTEDRLRGILDKNIWVYNCMHELPATLNWLDKEIKNIDDVFVMVKLMMGNSDMYMGSGGLKAQSVKHLGYKDWSNDLDFYFQYLLDYANKQEEMRGLMSKYYEGQALEDILKKIADLYYDEIAITKVKGTLSYELVPKNLISRYGSRDSSILLELKEFYEDWMASEGEKLGIDLFQGYKYWMMHHIAGYTLERNGAYWNEEKAVKVEEWCETGMHDALRELIKSPLSESYMKDKLRPQFSEYLKDNFLDKMLGDDFEPKRMYKSSMNIRVKNQNGWKKLNAMSIFQDGDKDIAKITLENMETLGKRFLDSNPDMFENWYKEYISKYINEEHTINDYKKLINPTATAPDFKDFISNTLVTSEIRYAKAYMNICVILEDPNFDYSLYVDPNDEKILKLVETLKNNENMDKSRKQDVFNKFFTNPGLKFSSWKIKRAISDALNYKMTTLDAKVLNEVYDLYLMCHRDIEDNSTWDERFRWLVNYKLYKKYAKIISTYINGKIGRNNVWYVDKNQMENGDIMVRRQFLYADREGKDYQNMGTILNAGFRVNTSETGRWQAGIHNLPAGEVIKGIYTSRYPGGCIMMPDGSQMEIRSLGAASGDENLLQAFRDKLDIHRFFASKIYQCDYDKVEKWQRGLAKNAVFGMVYGESEKAFADTYLHGDLARAQEIYSGMFDGFPKLKEYIDRAHAQYKKFQKVTTYTQRYIALDPDSDRNAFQNENAMLRRAQNYPIQGASEDLAGIIMYQIIDFINKNNMKTKIFCFIHDSIEMDIYPFELFRMIEIIDWGFNKFPQETFHVPVACDVPVGMNMGVECEIKKYEFSEDYNEGTFTLEGYKDDLEDLRDNWRTIYKVVDYEEDESERSEEYVPLAKAFLPVKAQLSMFAGKTRIKTCAKFHIIMK